MCLGLIFVNMVDEFYFDERQGKSSILLLLDESSFDKNCFNRGVLKFLKLKDMKFLYIYGDNEHCLGWIKEFRTRNFHSEK